MFLEHFFILECLECTEEGIVRVTPENIIGVSSDTMAKKDLSSDIKTRIIDKHKAGNSYNKISEQLHVP